MALKVHMMGPRDTKFPYKAQGSWFMKLDNKTHNYLKQRCVEKGETLEEALLATVIEGVEMLEKGHKDGSEHSSAQDS